MCLDTLARLEGVPLPVEPPKKYTTAMSHLMSGSVPPPWALVMTPRDHRAHVENIVNAANGVLATISKNYYVNTWVPQSVVLGSLQPPRISEERYGAILAEGGTNFRLVEGFKPDRTGHAPPIAYDRFGTRTGRLTVASGPNILTLKKEYRDMIVPSHPGGKIVYLDFAALEARVLLYEAGGRCDNPDLYSHINDDLFGGSAPRKSVKAAVISELYGSSKAALGAVLGIAGRELDDFVGRVKGYFKIAELRKRLKDEFVKTGAITNRYGRRVPIDEPLDHILVNSYAQSTGVDVSLLGFSDIVSRLADREGVRPLYVLHDALILDVPPEHLDAVMEIKHVTVPGYVQKFPISCDVRG
jgi:hypothetical protein